jgi:class 3 adenylate cyclase/TolB-like protein/Flp pilus assembly protein TadD
VAETRKLVAILAADVVGYSRLASTDEDRTLARLRALRSDLIDPTVAVYNGRVVKRTGDGSLIEFRSVVDAVRCAIEVQNGMVERNAGLPPERRIEFRVGVHLGDVVEESDGDLMGDGVNIAARLEGIAKPGAICLSEDAYRQVSGRLEMHVTDLGVVELKNIEKPIRAYSLQVGVQRMATQAKSKLRSSLVPMVLGAVALFAAAAAGVWHYLGTNPTTPVVSKVSVPAKGGRFSIVILPFSNLSGDPAQDYLADALTDELTTAIAKRLRDGFVIARSTAFTYKGKPVDPKTIANELDVHYMLEGSIQPSGTQVRVNAQLIDANSGAHVWADKFDTSRTDVLQMQDQIVTRLGRAISLELMDANRVDQRPATNTDANDLAWRCWSIARTAGWITKQAEAGYPFCEQALLVDPNNPVALRSLSVRFWLPVTMGSSVNPKADLERADDLVKRAIAAAPNDGATRYYKSAILVAQARFDEAIAEAEIALALDPVLADAYSTMAEAYRFQGKFEKSLESIDRAILMSPRDKALASWYGTKAYGYFALKDYDKATDWAQRTIVASPNSAFSYLILAAALIFSGREAEARDAMQQYHALSNSGFTIAAAKAWKLRYTKPQSDPRAIDLWDRWIEGLRKAGLPEQ